MSRSLLLPMVLAFCLFSVPDCALSNDGASSWLLMEYDQQTLDGDGRETSSASGRQSLIETVIGRADSGRIIEYDLPRDADGVAQSGFWYFPAKVVERNDGGLELLEPAVVEERIDRWLEDRTIPREACGMWSHGGGFPFKVDCDPHSVIEQISQFRIGYPDLRVGGEYKARTKKNFPTGRQM